MLDKKIMINSEINQYINDRSFDSNLRKRILEWSAETPFVNFLNNNTNKILKKLKTAKKPEDQYDVGLELYVAFIFATSNCEVVTNQIFLFPKILILK